MRATKQKVSPFIPLLVVFATTPLLGQLPTGSIVGTVYDRTGATVPSAQLVLNETATGNPRGTSTFADGGEREHGSGAVRCRERLGGLLKSYEREAA